MHDSISKGSMHQEKVKELRHGAYKMLSISTCFCDDCTMGLAEQPEVTVLEQFKCPGDALTVLDGDLADKVGLFELGLENLERSEQLGQCVHVVHV